MVFWHAPSTVVSMRLGWLLYKVFTTDLCFSVYRMCYYFILHSFFSKTIFVSTPKPIYPILITFID